MAALAFLTALFGDTPRPGREVVVWSRAGGATWCATCESAAEATMVVSAARHDAYFGCALQDWERAAIKASEGGKGPADRARTRGFASTTAGIGGLWLDVDWTSPAHQKHGLPPDRPSALSLLDALPRQPTIVLDTGGGLHAWWVLKEPWMFDSPDERVRAAWLLRAWQGIARVEAGRRGWAIDATHDLSRVLRLPGTTNWKHGAVVSIARDGGPRYNPSDFDDFVDEHSVGEIDDTRGEVKIDGVALDPAAQPPYHKLEVLLGLDAKFERTWRHARRDLPSQSEYDLSLAAQLAAAGWSDQEIVDALIAHRRAGGGPPKLRVGYYAVTIATARRTRKEGERTAALSAALECVEATISDRLGPTTPAAQAEHSLEGSADGAVPQDATQRLKAVSAAIGVEVVEVRRILGEPTTYHVVLAGGVVAKVGDVSAMADSRRFALAVLDAAKVLVPSFKAARWRPVAQALVLASRDVQIGEASTNARLARSWLEQYLERAAVARGASESVMTSNVPFEHDGGVYVRFGGFASWLRASLPGSAPSARELSRWLREAGLVPQAVPVTRADGRETTMNAWRVPALVASPARKGATR